MSLTAAYTTAWWTILIGHMQTMDLRSRDSVLTSSPSVKTADCKSQKMLNRPTLLSAKSPGHARSIPMPGIKSYVKLYTGNGSSCEMSSSESCTSIPAIESSRTTASKRAWVYVEGMAIRRTYPSLMTRPSCPHIPRPEERKADESS